IAAMLLAVDSGSQAALMAPTQILAEQHYAVLRNWLDPLGIRIALRTGARQEDNVPLVLFDTARESSFRRNAESNTRDADTTRTTGNARTDNNPTLQIIVGTHALLYQNVTFS